MLRSVGVNGHKASFIAANSDIGVLYGAFAFLRRMQTAQPIDNLDVTDAPRLMVRGLNHWDNLDGSIEPGFAGASLWRWQTLPAYRDPRYGEYARLNASIGINGAVLNNVNTSANSLTTGYIEKTAALAEEFRPYGVHVWMAPRFSAPQEIGHLKTSDPLDPEVRAWWKAKVEEIYKAIPDFGGFLVKANSEGQPGPQEYGRSHSDGANLFADLLAPHGGIVMYRAFVYDDPGKDWHLDRVAEAYRIIKPFDGQFRDNVLVQEKEGPLDFQPREPFAPLFGAMPKSNMAVEFPVTKEYTGQGVDLTYTGFMYEQIYRADTFAHGPGSTVAKIVMNQKLTGTAGVANIGNDRNWTGSIFNQANWYAYGRFAWNPESSARAVGEEWTRQTFGNDPKAVATTIDMLMNSWPAMMDYQSPIGLTFQELDSANTHYGPWPWLDSARRSDWADMYFNRADAAGLGVDRSHTGYNTAAQYNSPLNEGTVRRHRHHTGGIPALVPSRALGSPHEIRPHHVGGTAGHLQPRRCRGGSDPEAMGWPEGPHRRGTLHGRAAVSDHAAPRCGLVPRRQPGLFPDLRQTALHGRLPAEISARLLQGAATQYGAAGLKQKAPER